MPTVEIDTSRLEARLRELPGQAKFAAALTLTALAKDGQTAATARIERAFDRPVRFTQSAITIKSASKANLQSRVLAKDRQAEYLAIQETGGTRRPEPGRPIIVPVNIRVNAAGNIPRGALKRQIAKPTTFVSNQNTPQTAHLPPGVYQRFKRPKRKAPRSPKLLVALERKASYSPRFGFTGTVRQAVADHIEQRWEEAKARAIRTANR